MTWLSILKKDQTTTYADLLIEIFIYISSYEGNTWKVFLYFKAVTLPESEQQKKSTMHILEYLTFLEIS